MNYFEHNFETRLADVSDYSGILYLWQEKLFGTVKMFSAYGALYSNNDNKVVVRDKFSQSVRGFSLFEMRGNDELFFDCVDSFLEFCRNPKSCLGYLNELKSDALELGLYRASVRFFNHELFDSLESSESDGLLISLLSRGGLDESVESGLLDMTHDVLANRGAKCVFYNHWSGDDVSRSFFEENGYRSLISVEPFYFDGSSSTLMVKRL